ncbi:cytochrome P450 17A2 isoform X5 [Stigmatopora argus]
MSLFCWPLISVPLVLAVLAILVAATRRSGGMPGLPRLPVVGSLPWLGGHMPPHLLFTQLGARYGPLFDIYLGPHRTVVVNDHVHAREVLLQRGRDFAGRPSMVTPADDPDRTARRRRAKTTFPPPGQATTDLLTRDGKDIAFADYSPLWKLHRRLVHASFALFGEGSNRLQEMGEKMEPVFFFHPDRHGSGTRRFFFSSVRGGRPLRRAPVRGRPRRGPVAGGDGGRDQRGLHAGVRLRLQTRGRGAGRGVALQRRYRAHHHPGRTGGHLPLDEGFPQRVNERAESLRRRARPPPGAKAAGTQGLLAEPSRASRSPGRFAERSKFTRARRRAHHGRPRVDDGGGSLRCRRGDHVHHAPLDPGLLAPSPRGTRRDPPYLIVGVELRPLQVQERVQTELDEEVGDRAVRAADRARLPYLDAVISEGMRIRPVSPVLIPHVAMTDSSVGHHAVRRGTRVLVNMWAIHHDPSHWDRPDLFTPGRFLDERGRRVTPSCFPPPDLRGRLGVVLQPLPYKMAVTPRAGWAVGPRA